MVLKEYLLQKKQQITQFLDVYLNSFVNEHNSGPWLKDLVERLLPFCEKGKMLRGAQVFLASELYSGKKNEDCLRCAAAIELFQAGLLIHDDIMDKDTWRRGGPSLFYQYESLGKEKKLARFDEFGRSMAICAADYVYFIAYKLLSELKFRQAEVNSLFSRNLAEVCLGQMDDVYLGHSPGRAESERILFLYKQKTGRYTFSLPLACGALLAGVCPTEQQALEKIGLHLGVVFQLRDDLLGLEGDIQQKGKTIASDIMEGKQTLVLSFLEKSLNLEQIQWLAHCRETGSLNSSELEKIFSWMQDHQISKQIDQLIVKENDSVTKILNKLSFKNPKAINLFKELIAYNNTRKK